jgi:hypothetical protein
MNSKSQNDTKIHANAYGATDINCAIVEVYPISLMMDGRNKEKAYKGPQTPIYMIIPVHVFQSAKLSYSRLHCHFSSLAPCWPSSSRRRVTMFFSSGVKNLASHGKSTIIHHDMAPTIIVIAPAIRMGLQGNTFYNENPCPARVAQHTIHLTQSLIIITISKWNLLQLEAHQSCRRSGNVSLSQ